MPPAKDWNPEKITFWVHGFLETYDHLPSMRDMDRGAPNSRNRKIYGGVAGILAVAGYSAAKYGIRRHLNRKMLIDEVATWAGDHGPTGRTIKQIDLLTAREAGELSFHPDSISDHSKSWKAFLVEAGLAKYEWDPSECVQFARTLVTRYEHGKLQKLVGKFGVDGQTPDYSDFLGHYPDVKSFMFNRVHWENWQPKKERGPLTDCWIGYATLALSRADGDSSYITKEMDAMARIGIGPSYDLGLIGQLDPNRDPGAVGVWLQDQANEVRAGIKRGARRSLYMSKIHPAFLPELIDVGLLKADGTPPPRA